MSRNYAEEITFKYFLCIIPSYFIIIFSYAHTLLKNLPRNNIKMPRFWKIEAYIILSNGTIAALNSDQIFIFSLQYR